MLRGLPVMIRRQPLYRPALRRPWRGGPFLRRRLAPGCFLFVLPLLLPALLLAAAL